MMKLKAADFRVSSVPTLIRDEALYNLRQAIVSGFFKPGERLIERDLCEFLGVSRTLIREILRHLESERLITIKPRKGYVVTTITPDEAAEIYEVRALLEEQAMRAFTKKASNKQIKQLRKIANHFAKAAKEGEMMQLVTLMSEFYDVLLQGAGNSVITEILTQLHARISMLRATSMSQPQRVKYSVQEMFAIVDALEQRDAEAACKASTDHVKKASVVALKELRLLENSDK